MWIIPRILKHRRSILSPLKKFQSSSTAQLKIDRSEGTKPFEEIPKVPGLPFFGTSLSLLPFIGKYSINKFDEACKKKQEQFGDIFREDFTSFNKYLHVYNVKDIEAIFKAEGRYPHRVGQVSLAMARRGDKERFLNAGLLNEQGETWWKLRSSLQKHISRPQIIRNYIHSMDTVSCDFVERMKQIKKPDYEIEDFAKELHKWAFESIGLVTLDTRLGCLGYNLSESSEPMMMVETGRAIFDQLFRMDFQMPLWMLFPTPTYKKLLKNLEHFYGIATKYLLQARERLKDVQKSEPTFLELLLCEALDPRDVAVTINDMMLAGVDTTANSAAFFLYHMAKYPEEQERLIEEIDILLPQKVNPITSEVLSRASYLKACLKESMRCKPVVLGTTRLLPQDMVLSGFHVPAGTSVFLHLMRNSLDERHFRDAKSFRPSRWLRGNTHADPIKPFANLPFSVGPRSCVGRRVAEQELQILAIRILKNFRLDYKYGEMNISTTLVNVPDKPLCFEFHDRLNK